MKACVTAAVCNSESEGANTEVIGGPVQLVLHARKCSIFSNHCLVLRCCSRVSRVQEVEDVMRPEGGFRGLQQSAALWVEMGRCWKGGRKINRSNQDSMQITASAKGRGGGGEKKKTESSQTRHSADGCHGNNVSHLMCDVTFSSRKM